MTESVKGKFHDFPGHDGVAGTRMQQVLGSNIFRDID
jgi:hypothetical protein